MMHPNMAYSPANNALNDSLANLNLSPAQSADRSIAKKRSQRFTVKTTQLPSSVPALPMHDAHYLNMVPSNSSSDESFDSAGAFSFSPSVQSAQSANTNLSSHHARTNSQPQIWQQQSPNSQTWYDPMISPAHAIPQDYSIPQMQQPQMIQSAPLLPGQEDETDELIPTAVVMKNIPFSVSRDQLLFVMDQLNLVQPFAFNYHYDTAPVAGQQPVFRGLAFANFRTPQESTACLHALNGYELAGRRLRVEYKRVLRHGEKEKIEREKAIKRMRSAATLNHQPSTATLHRQPSSNQIGYQAYQPPPPVPQDEYEDYGQVLSSGTSQWIAQQSTTVPSPIGSSFPSEILGQAPSTSGSDRDSSVGNNGIYQNSNGAVSNSHLTQKAARELDMNDSGTLEIYSRVLLFKDDNLRDELAFARSLSAHQRRTVHLVAQKLGLDHRSAGDGDDRYVIVCKGGAADHSTVSSPGKPMSRRSTSNLRGKKSMPNMREPHSYNTGLGGRKSNNDLRSAGRRPQNSERNSYQHTNGYVPAPPVPALPYNIFDDSNGVLRQPRGPDGKGFRAQANNWRQDTQTAVGISMDG